MKKFLGQIVEHVSVALVVVLGVVVFLQVFNRYVLKAPLTWSEELAMLLFQWVAFLGSAVGVKRMSHFGIDLIVKKMPLHLQGMIRALIPVLMGVVAFVMVFEGVRLLQFTRNEMYTALRLSHAWAYAAIPVSGLLSLFYLLQREAAEWRGRAKERRGP